MEKSVGQELLEAVNQMRGFLEDLHHLGLTTLQQGQQVCEDKAEQPQMALTAAQRLDVLRDELGDCQRCTLSSKRNRIVFGSGNANARIVFVGEGPGREEDKQGIPFVGEAGQLLEKILFAMGFRREDVYICNVVKCRPPQNRDPKPDEVEACEVFLKQQLDAIKPQVIVALGRFAAQTLLAEPARIGQIRGQWREYQGIPLMVTYHPAYLLRNPSGKREVWLDVKQVLKRIQQTDADQ
jgi:DNA polymerase